MSAPTFTPGPWVARFGGLIEIEAPHAPRGPSGLAAVVAEVCDDGEDTAATRADAFLIAAAPDLYEALQVLLADHEEQCQCLKTVQAREALAKAEGR